METNELKDVLEKYFVFTFVILKIDFNIYKIHFRLNDDLILSFNYKWNNYFDKDTNVSAICNRIKEKIVNSFIR